MSSLKSTFACDDDDCHDDLPPGLVSESSSDSRMRSSIFATFSDGATAVAQDVIPNEVRPEAEEDSSEEVQEEQGRGKGRGGSRGRGRGRPRGSHLLL